MKVSLHTYIYINVKIMNILRNKFEIFRYYKIMKEITDSDIITEILYPSEEYNIPKI